MPEAVLSASAKLDLENNKLVEQLFGPTTTADIVNKIANAHLNLKIVSTQHTIQAMPATGELTYFHTPNTGVASELQEADYSIKFRPDGTIIYSESDSNFRTKYDPVTGNIARYDRTAPGIPDQILPRHAKHAFLSTVLTAEQAINELVEK